MFGTGVLKQLKILQMAQRAGCSIADMRLLVAGFSPDTPASERWKQLAQKR